MFKRNRQYRHSNHSATLDLKVVKILKRLAHGTKMRVSLVDRRERMPHYLGSNGERDLYVITVFIPLHKYADWRLIN